MIRQKTAIQTIHTATKVVTIFVLVWIFALTVLTIFNLCAIIKKDKVNDNNNAPPLVMLEYLEVD